MRRVDYDGVSASYDRRYRLGGPAGIAASLHELARKVGARRVLEVGCGTGHWLTQIKGPTIRCGLDYSAGMLEKARQREGSSDLVRGTARHLPFNKAAFDLVFCVHALHHFDDPVVFIQEARRVLGHNGALAVISMDPQTEQDRWYLYDCFPGTREADLARYPSGETILRWMAEAGFTGCERSLAARIAHDFVGPEVLDDPILHKDGTSQLSLLTDQAFQEGMARIQDSLRLAESEGRTVVFPTDIALPMVVGFVPNGACRAEEVPRNNGPVGETADLLALAECLTTTHYEPSEATFQHQLEVSILQHVERHRGERKWAGAAQSLVAATRLQLRPVLVGSLLVLLVAGVALLFLNPAARAQIEDVLRWTAVHEIRDLPQPFHLDGEPPFTELPSPVPLFIARIRAGFPIQQPLYVPVGYQFDGAIVLELHDFADGPTILLYYGSSKGGFVIEEFKPLYSVREAVATDSSKELEVNGQQALYVDGRWKIDKDGVYQGWVSDDHDRLLYEMDDIAIWIHASPPLGPDELVRIAESLH